VEVERDFKAFYSFEKSTYLAAWLSSIWEPIAASLYNRHAAYVFSVGTQEGWRNPESNNNSLTILTAGVYRVRRRFVACSIANNIPRA
jgi:hypothetical protein